MGEREKERDIEREGDRERREIEREREDLRAFKLYPSTTLPSVCCRSVVLYRFFSVQQTYTIPVPFNYCPHIVFSLGMVGLLCQSGPAFSSPNVTSSVLRVSSLQLVSYT